MTNDKLQDILRKLKALADKGIEGEKENAEKALRRLADKHGIDLSTLDDDARSFYEFNVKKHPALFYQIAANVLATKQWRTYKVGKTRGIECTKYQAIEIEAKYDFYCKEYDKDLKVFYKAFVHKNDLGVSVQSDDEPKELTREQKEEELRVSWMMEGLERKKYHKQLSHNNE